MKPKVLIYRDKGVGPLSYRALYRSLKSLSLLNFFVIETIDSQKVKEGQWKSDCALFILPGGRDVPYHQALQGKGNKQLKSYVERGGQFLGICAGAYYACTEVIFQKGKPEEVHQKRELAFFPEAAFGTLYDLKPYSYEGHTSAYPALVTVGETPLHVYYNGGCSFKNAEQFADVEILASYQDTLVNSPAIIECKVKKGVAILSGVHFEMEASSCKQEKELYQKLEASEPKRKELFELLISRLLVAPSFL